LRQLPISTSLLYLCLGAVLGPYGFALVHWDALQISAILERAAEIAVVVSLFTAGLKLRLPFDDKRWFLPLRLAFVSMTLTVGAIAAIGVWLLKLPLGGAILLGAILAPTDPVLASEVQVEEPSDTDRVRFSLTGEAGLNDGTAFPFVMLGLGLLGLHELGNGGWRWLAVDVLWAVGAGLGIGWLLGCLVGHLIVWMRARHQETTGLDDFLALGLITLSYGVALASHAYGFLAVFAAGLALRRVESRDDYLENNDSKTAATSENIPENMTRQVLNFNEQIERVLELGVVLVLGGLLTLKYLPLAAVWFVPLLFFLVRPVVVWLGLWRSRVSRRQKPMMMWFGIRGIGSIYYLMYAVEHGLPRELAQQLTALTFATIVASIIIHGISATPLMNRYKNASGSQTSSSQTSSS
jgi:NhaP-type Na+/H+ or K+/H+ antiporter